MIQILINKEFSTNENISSTASTLDYRNGYFVNFNTGRGGLTSQLNVQAFINNPMNYILVDNFYSYLQNNFSSTDILTIKNDNQSLSSNLNYYYDTFVASIISNSNFLPNPSGVTSTAQTFSDNLYLPNGNPANKLENGLIYSNSADSYYVTFVLFEKTGLLDDSNIFLEPDINNGFQIEKEIVQLNGLFINGIPVESRTATIVATPQKLLQGFVDLNLQDSPFNDYSNSGLDVSIKTFSGQNVYQINAGMSGNISSTENIYPIGVSDFLVGKNQTFNFKTINPIRTIESVIVDGVAVNYDRVGTLSKSVAGSYTFTSISRNHSITVNFI